MPVPARTLETDARWFKPDLDEIAFSAEVVFQPITFLRDAKAAHQLLDLAVLAACFCDQIESDTETGAALKTQAAMLREALGPWVPIPEADAPSVAFEAWMGRILAVTSGLSTPPESPSAIAILHDALREANIAKDGLERQLQLVKADADHLRGLLANERREAAVDLEHMRSATETMRRGADGVRLLGALLDRARNWVQDPELRAEITKHCPPTPRTEADRG